MPDPLEKFQGEPEYVPDFWARAQLGLADEVDGTVFRFTITKEDVKKYPMLKLGCRLLITESTDGFVLHEILAPRVTN